MLCEVCLLAASLMVEYLTVLSAGFVALLAGGAAGDGEAAGGEDLCGEARLGGDREAGRDAGRDSERPEGVLGPLGGAGGGVDGGSGMISCAKFVGLPPELPPEPPLPEAGSGIGERPCGFSSSPPSPVPLSGLDSSSGGC